MTSNGPCLNGVIKTAKDAILCKSGSQVSVLNSFYAERSIILNTVITKLIESLCTNSSTNDIQLLILGAGYDHSYETNTNAKIFIVDFPQIIEERMKTSTTDSIAYISCDLRDPSLLIQKLLNYNFSTSTYTIILLECVLSYIDTNDVHKLLSSLSSLSSSSFLILYDPIIPNTDGYFGTMIKKFSERGAPLLHISKSRQQHLDMLKSCGWNHGSIYTIGQASNCFLLPSQRKFISTAVFDEYASLALLRRYYAITISSNDSSMIFNNALQKITVSNDMTSLKSRIEVARLRLDSIANYNIKSSTTTTTANITIREARDVDMDEVKKLVSDVFEIYMETYPTVKKFMKRSISKLPQDINDNTSINKFWVAEAIDSNNSTKIIIGCIGIRVNDNNSLGEVIHTCVANSYRSKGVGQMLLRNVISYALGNSILSLHLSVMSFLTAAQALYLKMGFYNNNDTMKNDATNNNNQCYIVHMRLDLK